MARKRQSLPILALLVTLGACGSQVTVSDPQIPEPLIDKLPLSVAGRYPDSFNNFVHNEEVAGKEKWTINMGSANKKLFSQLFGWMFSDYREIGPGVDPRDLEIDALIEPSIDAFEFSVPNQSQTPEFAVWIRYRIKVFDKEGKQIANWPIAAYGKAQTSTFGGDNALQAAAVLAMRDAAALVILQMDKSTGISKLSSAVRDRALPATTTGLSENEIETTVAEESVDDTGN